MPTNSMNVRQAETFQLPNDGYTTTTESGVKISITRGIGRESSITIERTVWERYNCSHYKPISESIGNIVTFDEDTGTWIPVNDPSARNNFILLRNPINNRIILETKSQIVKNFLHILKLRSKENTNLDIRTVPFNFDFNTINVSANNMKNLSTKAPHNQITSINYSGPSIGHANVVTTAIANQIATHTIVDITINRIPYTISISKSGQVYFMTNVVNPRITLSQLLSMI